jgi:hypothetical protein
VNGAADATPDAYRILGLEPDSPWPEVRAAHRRLAKELHPDLAGGDSARMTAVNLAFAALVAARSMSAPPEEDEVAERGQAERGQAEREQGGHGDQVRMAGTGTAEDPVTFAVDILPVEAFEALLIVSSFLGDPWVIDEPYELTVLLDPPLACRCHLTLVPEAGGTIVTVEVDPRRRHEAGPTPAPAAVAAALIAELERLGD